MKNQIQRDQKKRGLNLKSEKKRIILKSIMRNYNITRAIRWNSELKLTELNSNSHKTRLVKRCILTGRKGKVHNTFRYSRLSFLKFAQNGIIHGLKKSVR